MLQLVAEVFRRLIPLELGLHLFRLRKVAVDRKGLLDLVTVPTECRVKALVLDALLLVLKVSVVGDNVALSEETHELLALAGDEELHIRLDLSQ